MKNTETPYYQVTTADGKIHTSKSLEAKSNGTIIQTEIVDVWENLTNPYEVLLVENTFVDSHVWTKNHVAGTTILKTIDEPITAVKFVKHYEPRRYAKKEK